MSRHNRTAVLLAIRDNVPWEPRAFQVWNPTGESILECLIEFPCNKEMNFGNTARSCRSWPEYLISSGVVQYGVFFRILAWNWRIPPRCSKFDSRGDVSMIAPYTCYSCVCRGDIATWYVNVRKCPVEKATLVFLLELVWFLAKACTSDTFWDSFCLSEKGGNLFCEYCACKRGYWLQA